MDRGWGLALDNSGKVGFFGNKPFFGVNLSPTGSIMFPVTSRGREDKSSPPPHGEQRLPLGEVDFFAEKKRPANGAVKKEDDSHAEASAVRESDVNTGLQLVTANTGSDQSTVDDGVSYDGGDKRAKMSWYSFWLNWRGSMAKIRG